MAEETCIFHSEGGLNQVLGNLKEAYSFPLLLGEFGNQLIVKRINLGGEFPFLPFVF